MKSFIYEIHIKYYCSNQMKYHEMGGTCGACGEQKVCIKGFDGEKRKGKRRLERTRRRWEDNIQMNLNGILWCLEWIYTGQSRALNRQ